ncbi:MAG: hypothetical protein LC687_00705 [Actinobacteria bacterium]|nr:hypothetical protein [Actinomycetota bacterium]
MVAIYLQEQRYESDNDMTPRGFVFDNMQEAEQWLEHKGYERIPTSKYPARLMNRWKRVEYNSYGATKEEVIATVFHATHVAMVKKEIV